MKKICVVGAGPSGLVSIKELSQEGFDVVCYENQSSFGGAFRSTENGGRSYESLELTVSNYFMAYSDYLPNEQNRIYWTVAEYRSYLANYIKHFNLNKNILYSHRVDSIQITNGKVVVQVLNKQNQEYKTEIFDFLVICSGSNFEPYMPVLNGINKFKGKILHSVDYIDAKVFTGKKVICIGLGESGADVVHEVSQVATCHTLIRDYPNVVPKWIQGHTNDTFTSSFFYSMGKYGIDLFMKSKAYYYLNFGKKLPSDQKLVQEWIYRRKSFIGKFLTKSDVFIKDIVQGKLNLIVDTIKHFTPQGVMTSRNNYLEADVVIFNTGYKTTFDNYSFGRDFENPRSLYKNMLHPKHGTLISLIGWARPSQGGLPACSEMQARYLAKLIAKKKELPSPSKMNKCILKDTNYYNTYFDESRNIKSLVNYYDFMRSMSKLIGCRPKSFIDFRLAWCMFLGSHVPMIYRLNEPALRSEIVSRIKSLSIPYSFRRLLIIMLIIVIYRPIKLIKLSFKKLINLR